MHNHHSHPQRLRDSNEVPRRRSFRNTHGHLALALRYVGCVRLGGDAAARDADRDGASIGISGELCLVQPVECGRFSSSEILPSRKFRSETMLA